jgi:hypothetical protein
MLLGSGSMRSGRLITRQPRLSVRLVSEGRTWMSGRLLVWHLPRRAALPVRLRANWRARGCLLHGQTRADPRFCVACPWDSLSSMSAIETAVRVIMDLLVRGDYSLIENVTHHRNLTANQIERAVSEYGRRLVPPPDTWWETVEVTPIDVGERPSFNVVAPVWTEEEGRSDLSLELLLTEFIQGAYDSELLGLYVP